MSGLRFLWKSKVCGISPQGYSPWTSRPGGPLSVARRREASPTRLEPLRGEPAACVLGIPHEPAGMFQQIKRCRGWA